MNDLSRIMARKGFTEGSSSYRPNFGLDATPQHPAPRYRFNHPCTDTIWTDRTSIYRKVSFEKLWQKHLGALAPEQVGREAGPVEAFLAEWLGKPVRLCAVDHHFRGLPARDAWQIDYAVLPGSGEAEGGGPAGK
jgi:hypothetical protein